jgi:hypothetical protein
MRFQLKRALVWNMGGRASIDLSYAPEILARVACLHGRPLHAELLTVDGAVQRVEVELVVREDRQAGDAVADASIGKLTQQSPLSDSRLLTNASSLSWGR